MMVYRVGNDEMEGSLMQAYVINLARSSDRRAHIITELGKTNVNYEIVTAIDGRDLDLSDARVVDPAFAATCVAQGRPAVVGCALSHLAVYRRILDDSFDIACVLEDDVVLPEDLSILTDAITQHMSGADVVLLNFVNPGTCRITKTGAVQLPSSRLLAGFADEGQVRSAGGYMITREACERMVKVIPPVRIVADNWAFFRQEGAIDRLRCVVPMPVVQDPFIRTTLSYYRPGSLYGTIREAVAGSKIPILHQVLALRRRRLYRHYAIGRTEFVEEFPGGSPESRENH
jgi:glycosyl transferase family 25